MWLSVWEDLVQGITVATVWFSDFAFFLYGVPVLLAISSPAESQVLPFFVWMDGIQAVLTAYLTYITIFSVVPFTAHSVQPISPWLLMRTYNIENLALAGVATLRLLAQPKEGTERGFYQTLCSFLWAYAVFAGIYNYCVLNTAMATAVYDPLADVPFLFLAAAAISPLAREREPAQGRPKKVLGLFIDNASQSSILSDCRPSALL